MTTYATTAFMDRWSNPGREDRIALITLTLITGQIYRMSTEQITTPDGTIWDPIIEQGASMSANAPALSGGPDLAVLEFNVVRKKLIAQATATQSVLDALQGFDFRGATVIGQLWVRGLTSIGDALQFFSGRVSNFDINPDGATFSCKQQSTWNYKFPDVEITRANYKNAPDASIGQSVPIIIGRRTAEKHLAPFTTSFGDAVRYRERLGGATLLSSGVIVDGGRNSSLVSVLFASHKLSLFGDRTNGTNIFIRGGDSVSEIEATTITASNNSDAAGFTAGQTTLTAWGGVMPSDYRKDIYTSTLVVNPLNALDLFRPESYMTLSATSGTVNQHVAGFVLPNASALGNMIVVPGSGGNAWAYVVCIYSTKAGSPAFTVQGFNPINGQAWPVGAAYTFPATTSHDDIQVGVHSWWKGTAVGDDDFYSPPDQWNFGGGANALHEYVDLTVKFSSVSANAEVRIYKVGLMVNYVPSITTVRAALPAKKGTTGDIQGRNVSNKSVPTGQLTFSNARIGLAGVFEVDSDFFCNAIGMPDDASGTYTGVPNAVIERPADVMKMLLMKYAKVVAGSIETTASTFGSLTDARTFQTMDGMLCSASRTISRRTSIVDCISGLAQDFCALWFINRCTGKHSLVRWDIDAVSATYDRTLKDVDLLESRLMLRAENDAQVVNEIESKYGDDHFARHKIHNVTLGGNFSTGGYAQEDLRDCYMTVKLDVNDTLDFTTSDDGTVFCTLTQGDYTPAEFVQHVRSKMSVAAAGTPQFKVEWGFLVIAGYNDKLTVNESSSSAIRTLTPGVYSGAGLAAHVAAELEAAKPARTWSVVYANQRFTISTEIGTSFSLNWQNSATDCCAGLLGFVAGTNGAAQQSTTSFFPVGQELIHIQSGRFGGTLSLLTASGAHNAKSAWPTLGFRSSVDYTGAAAPGYTSAYRRSARERSANRSKLIYGPKDRTALSPDWIDTTVDALDIRDRVFDWRVEPLVTMRFATMRMPDIERGMVFYTDTSIGNLFPTEYGASAWGSRKWMVTEVNQKLGPTWETEVVAVEVMRRAGNSISDEMGGGLIGGGITPPPVLACQQVLITTGVNDKLEWGT